MSGQQDCAVIIVGGGPCGLALAIELGRRGVSTILLEEKTSPARFPAANATQARTMEHYRRLGFAEQGARAGSAARLPDRYRLFHPLHQARAGAVQPAVGAGGPRDRANTDRLLERGGTAAPGFADVRRGRVARRGGRLSLDFDPARLAHDCDCARPEMASRSMPNTTVAGERYDARRLCVRRRRRRRARRARRSASASSARAAWCATSWAGVCSRSISAVRNSTACCRIRAPGCTGRSTASAAASWRA